MCIIAYIPENETIGKKKIRAMFTNNPDGCGFMYCDDGKVKIEKPFFDVDHFIESLREKQNEHNSPFVLHFRITTSGKENKLNTHPHRINNNLAMVHNGIMSQFESKDNLFSDTVMFCEHFRMMEIEKMNVGMEKLLERFIGYNKLVFLDGNKNVSIVNEPLGKWHSGCWYSNSSYEFKKSYFVTSKTETELTVSDSEVELFTDNDVESYYADPSFCCICREPLAYDEMMDDDLDGCCSMCFGKFTLGY